MTVRATNVQPQKIMHEIKLILPIRRARDEDGASRDARLGEEARSDVATEG